MHAPWAFDFEGEEYPVIDTEDVSDPDLPVLGLVGGEPIAAVIVEGFDDLRSESCFRSGHSNLRWSGGRWIYFGWKGGLTTRHHRPITLLT
jgi:hypothetical protein